MKKDIALCGLFWEFSSRQRCGLSSDFNDPVVGELNKEEKKENSIG